MPAKITKLRLVTGAVVLGAAAGSGYFMQSGAPSNVQTAGVMSIARAAPVEVAELPSIEAPAELIAEEVTRAAVQPVLAVSVALPVLPIAPRPEEIQLASAEADATAEPVIESVTIAEQTITCETGFTAMAAPGAMVDLTFEAPCYAGQSIDVFHAGLRFTEQLDANGLMQISVPALEEDAIFNVLLADGRNETTDLLMLTVTDYQRVALAWKGQTGFDLYALENGAVYGEAGHVGVATPFTPDRGVTGQGGFLTQLGQSESGYFASVYSYPAMLTDSGTQPEISIEAVVLAATCGTEISATLMRATDLGTFETSPLTMMVPGCETVGEFLVLKNLPQTQRIASN